MARTIKTKKLNFLKKLKNLKFLKNRKISHKNTKIKRKNGRPEIVVDMADGVIIPIDSSLCLKWKSCVSLGSPEPTISWHIDI